MDQCNMKFMKDFNLSENYIQSMNYMMWSKFYYKRSICCNFLPPDCRIKTYSSPKH